MGKLEEAYNALAAHIDIHAKNGPYNGFVEVAKDLGMSMDDQSGGSDIHYVLTMEGKKAGKLSLIYLLVPVGDDDLSQEKYWLEMSGMGKADKSRDWLFLDGEATEREPVSIAA